MKVGDLVDMDWSDIPNDYNFSRKFGLGIVTEIYDCGSIRNKKFAHDVEVWFSKPGTSRTIGMDTLEVVCEG